MKSIRFYQVRNVVQTDLMIKLSNKELQINENFEDKITNALNEYNMDITIDNQMRFHGNSYLIKHANEDIVNYSEETIELVKKLIKERGLTSNGLNMINKYINEI